MGPNPWIPAHGQRLSHHRLVTLFVIIDPIGMAPLFMALTQGMTSATSPASRCAPA